MIEFRVWLRGLLAWSMLLAACGVSGRGVSAEETVANADAQSSRDKARLQAVVEFADNVLEQGRDRYGPEPTPLFVDGLNVDTRQPVRWVQNGQEWICSNLANQQNLFRTLVGLTNLTGEARYRQAAEEAIAWHFDHLQSPCGLLRWGGHHWIDLATGESVGEGSRPHELKFNLPFYELMWQVNPTATERFIKAFWNAHVLDWGTLDMNRHGTYGQSLDGLWDQPFDDPEPFFEGRGLTFINCGSDLIYAAAVLHQLNGDEGALAWSQRLAEQYVKARHPDTRLGVYQYSKPRRQRQPPETGPLPTSSTYGDRAENQFAAEFGDVAREGYMLRSPASVYGNSAIVQLQLAELLGEDGEAFLSWTQEGLAAFAQYGYDPAANSVRPMLADGTDLTGHTIQRSGYYGAAGREFKASPAPAILFWSYALGYRLTGEAVLWQTARSMARGHGLGDLGPEPGEQVLVNLRTNSADPMLLFGLLEVLRSTDAAEYRDLARRLGDNIVEQHLHRGFFLPSADHLNANFNTIEPLVLLALEAALRGTPEAVPRYNSGRGYLHAPHDGMGRTNDSAAIWSRRR